MSKEKCEGTVKFYNEKKGFGFIINHTEKSSEIFFHFSKVNGVLPKADDVVEFDMEETKKGPAAINVTVLE